MTSSPPRTPDTIWTQPALFEPSLVTTIETVWNGVALAIALVIYAIVVTVIGVAVAGANGWWLAAYACASLGFLAALIFVEPVRRRAIQTIRTHGIDAAKTPRQLGSMLQRIWRDAILG